MNFNKTFVFYLVVISVFIFSAFSLASGQTIILATTTSTVDSGLLDVLLPVFEKQSGYTVKTIGVGSGMAMEMGRRGQADVLLVHSPKDEEKLIKEGFGVNRRPVMHNDFVLVGPVDDPAGAKKAADAGRAFKRILGSGALFVSRGDRSGTHAKELSLWPCSRDKLSSPWHMESGQGMGATLLIADQKNAYTLADRATYLNYKKRIRLVVLREGDKQLLNPYHVIEVSNSSGAKAFAAFLVAPAAQKLIAGFGRDKYGHSLFFPDAVKNKTCNSRSSI